MMLTLKVFIFSNIAHIGLILLVLSSYQLLLIADFHIRDDKDYHNGNDRGPNSIKREKRQAQSQ